MAVPNAVKQQAEAAEAAYQKRYGNTELAPGAVVAQPVQPAVEAPAAVVPAVTADDPNSDTWKHRFHVLQGKYNAEVPNLQGTVRQLQQSVQALDVKLNEKSQAAAAQPLITPEEVTEYGAPLTDYIKRASKEALAPLLAEIKARLGDQVSATARHVENLQSRTAQTQREAFFAGLKSIVPDWEAVNDTPAFLAWLEEVDPLARARRQSLLEAAQNDFDVNGVAAFFKQWKAAQPAPRTVESQIVPPQGQNNQPPVNQGTNKKIWTEQEIAQFYDGVRRGRYKKEDAERIEQEINVAAQEGRVRTR